VSDIWENPLNGKIYIVGDFEFSANGQGHYGLTSMNLNGRRNLNYQGLVGGDGWSLIWQINDTTLINAKHGLYRQTDFNGATMNLSWRFNYAKTVSCVTTVRPYFFDDGSSLMSNDTTAVPMGCDIFNPPDTFPHRYVIKVDPQGYWDSSFVPDANHPPKGFLPYDSNRLFVYGLSRDFTHYDGRRVNGLCRIYEDGTLDTTFNLVLSDTAAPVVFSIQEVQNDGKFFLCGYYILEDYPNQTFTLARFNADGTLDSTFNNFNGPRDTNPGAVYGLEGTNDICATPDGGYLVGGLFNSYQGFTKHNIAKIDSNGNVEPQYFTTVGPDSAVGLFIAGQDTLGNVHKIHPSKFGGYYVMGDFFTWDGAPVQGIVRIKDKTVGLKSIEYREKSIEIFPNPTLGEINISSTAQIAAIEIYDLLGKRVR
jgi:hypothetical protein